MRRDPVTPELRDVVIRRDRMCVLALLSPGHSCRDRWGNAHAASDRSKLTVEHVKSALRMGVRAPSDEAHLVALCAGSNVDVPSKIERERMRAYLRRRYPEAWGG